MKLKHPLLLSMLLLVFCSQAKPLKIKTGVWYTSIQLNNEDNLPILVDVQKTNGLLCFTLINGSEKILLDKIQIQNDSIFIAFPNFASEFRAKIHNKTYISGRWYNHARKGNYYLPFWSKFEYADKYPVTPPIIDVNGRWEVTFDYEGDKEPAVGIFNSSVSKNMNGEQLLNRVTGTFMTETGDYRFLEGVTIQDSLYLSTFDGSHAFLFKAKLVNDTLWGDFLSGKHYKSKWFALKNSSFEIGHPDSLTYLTSETKLSFILPDIDGGNYNFPADASENKLTLIQIMGTWCPNCLDESIFLKELYETYHSQLDIVAIAFETQKEFSAKVAKVRSYQNNLDLPYHFLIGGDACKPCATELFPMLSTIISFPTLIFVDQKGEIRKIHTGFNGPGTGLYYTQFKASIIDFIDLLLAE